MTTSNTTLLTEDTTGADDFETKAVERRAEAFRAQLTWKDIPLLWTITRETLYFWLRIPMPRLPESVNAAYAAAREADGTAEHPALLDRANKLFEAFQEKLGPDNSRYLNALILLYLMTHHKGDWRAFKTDREQFLERIEEWSDENVAAGQMAEVWQITNQVIADAESTKAIVQPKDNKGVEEGN